MFGAFCGLMVDVSSSSSTFCWCWYLLLVVTSSLAQTSLGPIDGAPHSHNQTRSQQDGFGHMEENDPTLLLVQVVFRHGDRSPLFTFPTDSHHNDWPQGYGQLTELGMTQGYELGQFLGRQYSDFLGQGYKPDEVRIESSDKDRALMTAQCVAAGLFPRQRASGKEQQWLPWQPVPVHTMPRSQDKILSPDKACSYVKDLKYGLKAYFYSQQDIMKDKGMMFAMSRHTGLVMNFTTLYNLADTLFCQKVHNMSLPGWLDDAMERRLFSFYRRLPVLVPEEAKYLAGILFETLTDNMLHKAHNPSDTRKLYLYSAHQGNLHSLMSLLGVFHKDTTIPYASAVVLELHRLHRKLYVKILYKTSLEAAAQTLHLPGCKHDLCPISALSDLWEESAHKAWEDMCGSASHENVIDFGENTIPILVTAVVVFIFLDFFLLYKTFKYRQRLHSRGGTGKDVYALVPTLVGSSSGSDADDDDDEREEEDDEDIDNTDEDRKTLLSNSRQSRRRGHKRHRQQPTRQVLNGTNGINGIKAKGHRSRSKGKGATGSDDCEETSLFVAPAKSSR